MQIKHAEKYISKELKRQEIKLQQSINMYSIHTCMEKERLCFEGILSF